MKKSFSISILLVCLLALSLAFVGCNNGTTGGGGGSSSSNNTPAANTDPKTLVITNIPRTSYDIGVYPKGTSLEDAYNFIGLVAYADAGDTGDDYKWSGSTLTTNLYNAETDARWTGNGTYDIYVAAKDGHNIVGAYKAANTSITSATTTIEWSKFIDVTP